MNNGCKTKGDNKKFKYGIVSLFTFTFACCLFLFTMPALAASISVDSYGAIPDDSLDDGVAIRKAVEAARLLGPGTEVEFSEGKYVVHPPKRVWDFNSPGDFENWQMTHDVAGTVSGGNLNLTVSGSDPYIKSEDHLGIDSSQYKLVKIKMKNNTTSTMGQFFWNTTDDASWKSVNFTITEMDDVYTEYVIDVGMSADWSGTIKQIRVDPEQGASTGTVNIDYIKVAVPPLQKWEFNELEAWTVDQHISSYSVSGGSLNLTISGNDPFVTSPNNLGIPTSQYKFVRINVKNNTTATKGQLYWITDADTTWNDDKRLEFYVPASATAYSFINLDLQNHSEWNGTIKQIRVHPEEGASSGTVNIDYIRLATASVTGDLFVNVNYHLLFPDLNGISFIGSTTGTTELNFADSLTGGFKFDNGNNVTIKGITLDYSTPPFVQGEVSDINATNGTFDYVVESGYTLLDDPRLAEITVYAGTVRDPNDPHKLKETTTDYWALDSFEKLNATTYRIKVKDYLKPYLGSTGHLEVEDKFVFFVRGMHNNAIVNYNSTNLTVEDVSIYAAPISALIFNRGEGLTVDHLTVSRRPGSGRWVSVNGDGMHLQSERSGPTIRNSTFEGMHDDGINIYTSPGLIKSVISDTKIAVAFSSLMPLVHDTLQVFDPVNGRIRGTATVTVIEDLLPAGCSGSSCNEATLTLSSPIPGMVSYEFGTDPKKADSVFNLSTTGSGFIIENNTFQEHRARGVFVKAAYGGTIHSNTFQDITGSAILIGNDPNWPEGLFASGVNITDNTITNVGVRDNYGQPTGGGSAIRIHGSKLGHGLSDDRGQNDILIQNNTITRPPRDAINIGSARNVDIIGNTIAANSTDPAYGGDITGIKLENAANVTIEGLTMNDLRTQLNAGIQIGSASDNVITSNLNFTLAAGVPNVLWLYSFPPAGLSASAVSDTQVNLDWSDNTDPGFSSYNVYRSTTGGFIPSWSNRIATGVTGSSYSSSGLSAATTYYYKVTAIDSSGTESAASNQASATTSATSNAFSQFSGTQGQNQWFYQYWDGSAYHDMTTYDSGNNRWDGPTAHGLFLRIFNSSQSPGLTADSVRKWVAPGAGTVTISGNVRKGNIGGGDGVNAKIVHGSTTIFNQDVAYNDNVGYNINLTRTVNAGDAIYFRVNMKSTDSYDNTLWSQTVVFTPSTAYNAQNQFSDTQGQNQWSYQYWDGSVYRNMTYDSANARWNGPASYGDFLRVFAASQAPGTSADSVRKWVAPGAGTVMISGNVRKGNVGGGDGVNAKIVHGSTTIFNQDIAYDDNVGYNINLTRTVSAGDAIYFRVNMKSTEAYDNTIWSQTIVFTP